VAAIDRAAPLRRVAQGLMSQGLASLSNFLLVIMVARETSPAAFGAFAIAYSVALLLTGVLRGVVGETLTVTVADGSASDGDTASAVGAAIVCGAVGGFAVASAGMLWPHELLGRWLRLFALAIPLLALQDAVRFVGFSTHRPHIAAASDSIWLGLQVLGWATIAALGELTGEWLLAIWWLTAGLGAIALLPAVGLGGVPRAFRWLSENWRIGFSFGAEYLLHAGTVQAAVYAVGFAAGLPAAGALRAAQSLFGPVRSAGTGLAAVALPEAVRRRSTLGTEALRRYTMGIAGAASALAVFALGALSLLPHDLGRSLLGETWRTAAQVVPAVGVSMVGLMLTLGARLGLRAIHEALASLRLRAVTGLLSLALGTGGAAIGGLIVAAWGLAIAHALSAVLGWWLFIQKARPNA
jgi:O-antigen/teichoic acid export membrane protein